MTQPIKQLINNKEYLFLTCYQHDDHYRSAFNQLSKKVFSLCFEVWYQSGYWRDKYIPYTLFDGDKAVANVSANIMDFLIDGKQQRYIQLGTVMTDENYRNQNLNRFLMDYVLNEWKTRCDFIYLFANGTVLDFYPKFGFSLFNEYAYSKHVTNHTKHDDAEKLNMDMQVNRDRLYDYVKHSEPYGRIAMNENADLVMFYCITIHKDHVYYLKTFDAFVIAEVNEHLLHILGVFSKNQTNLDEIITTLSQQSIKEVLLGFTPDNHHLYEIKKIESDDYLFIQQNKTVLFNENKLMFPLLSHA